MLKRAIVVLYTGLLLTAWAAPPSARNSTMSPPQRRFPDARDAPPSNHTGTVFRLSQDYPTVPPAPTKMPWEEIDFRTQWREYLGEVLRYCYEGNIEVDWVVQENKTRRWFHAPWLHWGRNGREFMRGLTHERVSEPEELARTQTSRFQNWAVGMYNEPGGYVIGQVWGTGHPDPTAARFPHGTVAVKLLFTQATEREVPYLKGSKVWKAHIYRETVIPTNPLLPRVAQELRLLQIDIAVRDRRADETTGWVFGTFVYNGRLAGSNFDWCAPSDSPWCKMVPVGVMWGNDPGVTLSSVRQGRRLEQTVINHSKDVPYQHLGWAGRLNGPVDNPISSCLSCHSTAQWPTVDRLGNIVSLVPAREVERDSEKFMKWFRNVKAEEPFSEDGTGISSLGYSLQLLVGIQNFYEWKKITETSGGVSAEPAGTTVKAAPARALTFPGRVPASREAIPPEKQKEP
jgi:hypothetical protein